MSSDREMGMDCLYGHASDFLRIDDLLDLSNVEIFDPDVPSNSTSPVPLPESSCNGNRKDVGDGDGNYDPLCTSFSDDFCLPSEDVAELEWLSKFVDDSFSDDLPLCGVTGNEMMGGNANFWPDTGVPGRSRSKRSRAAAPPGSWTSFPSTAVSEAPPSYESSRAKAASRKKEITSPSGGSAPAEGVRKCTHCATEKTPQWRTGPMGPKSLCNACGVRYKSGRLVPEYRPAASPTFVLTQHSNSHRKVMELRRQKEILRQEKFLQDFKVC